MATTNHSIAATQSRTAYQGGIRTGYELPALRGGLSVWQQTADRFWNSRYYFPALLGLASVMVLSGSALEGMALFALLCAASLAFCADLLATLCPFTLLMLMSTAYYEDSAVLYDYWWIALPAAAALVLRMSWYRVPFRRGRCTGGLAAVSAATLLGGLGAISAEDYFSPVGLYYSVGLGAAMLAFYFVLRAELARRRDYAVEERFAAILYAVGIFTGVMVLTRYAAYLDFFARNFQVIYIPCRNYFATMMLMALPVPCWFMKKSRWHAAGLAFLYVSLLLTGSRSALLFGTALLALSLLWMLRREGGRAARRGRILGLLLGLGALCVIFFAANTLFSSRAVDGELISLEDSRITFFLQGIRDFLANPLTGQGLGNMKNSVIFIGVRGSMVWYHNYIAQIIGSMGLIGVAAYAWLLRDRVRLLLGARGTDAEVLGLAYLGMLLISMTNPGEFSPLPGELLVVTLFAVLEEASDRETRKKTAALLMGAR